MNLFPKQIWAVEMNNSNKIWTGKSGCNGKVEVSVDNRSALRMPSALWPTCNLLNLYSEMSIFKMFPTIWTFSILSFSWVLFKMYASYFIAENPWTTGIKAYQPKIGQWQCRHFDTRVKCTLWNAVDIEFLHVGEIIN